MCDWARNGGNFHPSHLATQRGWVAAEATLLEWLSGWVAGVDDKLPSTSGGLAVWKSFFRCRCNSKPAKFFTTHIVCGMTWRRLNLYWRHLNLYSLLAPFRDNVRYLYVAGVSTRYGPLFVHSLIRLTAWKHCIAYVSQTHSCRPLISYSQYWFFTAGLKGVQETRTIPILPP